MIFVVVERRDISPTALTNLGAFTTVHIVKTSLSDARTVHVRLLIVLLNALQTSDCMLLILRNCMNA